MPDEAIYELTQETALNAADRFIVQQTSAATRATSATYALMSGLVPNAQTPSANITGAVGNLYVITTTSMTGNINVTVPSANVGERVGVYCNTDEPDHEIVIIGAASQTINGGAAATAWSTLHSEGECVILRCISANTWIVEVDGRLPDFAWVYQSSVSTAVAADTWQKTENWTVDAGESRGNIANTTNDQIDVRRTSAYYAFGIGTIQTTLLDGEYVRIAIHDTSAFKATSLFSWNGSGTTTNSVAAPLAAGMFVTAGDVLEWQFRHGDASANNRINAGKANNNMFFREVLP